MEDWKEWLRKNIKESTDDKWNFEKFKIQCSKCNSFNVEINGEAESEGGYYGAHNLNFNMLVKCHDCGNAMAILSDYENEKKF